jgi:hypothetical protein
MAELFVNMTTENGGSLRFSDFVLRQEDNGSPG